MPNHGGRRPGAGRPRGATTAVRRDLLARVEALDGDLADRLATVAEDDTASEAVRLEAVRHLSGSLAGKIRLEVKGARR